jgi:hypothetical protein
VREEASQSDHGQLEEKEVGNVKLKIRDRHEAYVSVESIEKITLTAIAGFVPILGYHHVLMILIAVAIILLCTLPNSFPRKPSC